MSLQTVANFKFTTIGLFVSTIFLILSLLFDLDLFEKIVDLLHSVEAYDVDELLIALFIISAGLLIDYHQDRIKKEYELEHKRLKALKATMSTVHDIVNNFLNNIHLFIFEAKAKKLTPESIETLEKLIQETADELRELGDVESVREIEVVEGIMGIDYKTESAKKK